MKKDERRVEPQELADQLAEILHRFAGGAVEVIVKAGRADQTPKRYLTRKEAADYLGVSVRTVDGLVDCESIPFTRIPSLKPDGRGFVRFDARRLDKWMACDCPKPRPAARKRRGRSPKGI